MMIIDRFEENFAVIESDNGMIEIERKLLPENASEGDVIILTDGVYAVDTEATESRRMRIRNKLKMLRRSSDD